MCEPFITTRTGLSVAEHQRRTVTSLLALRDLDPGLPVIPVLQGWTITDYLRCADLLRARGDQPRRRALGWPGLGVPPPGHRPGPYPHHRPA